MRSPPKDRTGWVFHTGAFSPRDFRKIMVALPASWQQLGKKRDNNVLVTPNLKQEKAVYNICCRLFSEIDKETAAKLLSSGV